MTDTPPTRWPGRGRLAAPALLFGLALAVRALPFATVLGSDRVYFVGMDAYYHMRRILYAAVAFPSILDFDRYVHFPEGGVPIWPPFFDAAIAWLALPAHALGGEIGLEQAVVWVPPLLGAACVVAVWALARRHFDAATALGAGLVLCVLSGHYWYSQLGFVDHHAAVALATTALLAAGMTLLARLASESVPRVAPLPAVALGALAALCLIVWPGSLLHVGIVEAALLGFLATRPTREAAASAAVTFAILHAAALVVVAPASFGNRWPQWGAYSPVVLSSFQPWLFASLALHASLCAALWRRGSGASGGVRAAQTLALGAVLLVLSAVALPGWLDGLADAWRWMAKREAFQASISESKPLFEVGGAFGVRIAEARLSRFLYVFPLALAWLVWSRRNRPDRAATFLLAGWCVALGAATLLQKRFFNSFSVVVALVTAWTLVRAWGALAARPRPARTALCIALAAVAALLIAPTLAAYRAPLEDLSSWLRGEPVAPRSSRADLERLVEAADWLRRHTPETSGFFDASVQPEYGVMSLHGNGHVIEYVGRRPTVVDNFGDDLGRANHLAAVEYFSARREADAVAILERLDVRYVLAEAAPLGVARPEDRPMIQRLTRDEGRGLGRHRLVFATARSRQARGRPYKVFERVAGARVRGRAPPGEEVTARLRYATRNLLRHVYEVRTRADDRGDWEMRLAHSTRSGPAWLRPEASYSIETGARRARLVVDERAVQDGEDVGTLDLGP